MTNTIATNKVGKKSKSLEEEIILQREKLKRLEDRHKEQQRKEKERNQKLVIDLVKSERLDLVAIEQWRFALPTIIQSLKQEYSIPAKKSEASKIASIEAETAI